MAQRVGRNVWGAGNYWQDVVKIERWTDRYIVEIS